MFKVSIEFRGATWYHTGKVGHDIRTSEATAEYQRSRIDGMTLRLWANEAGRVTTENA